MDCSMLTKEFGIVPSPWSESLSLMVKNLYE